MSMRTSVIAVSVAFTVLIASGCTSTRDQKSTNAYVDDRIITSTINSLYAQSKEVAITNISVETLYGVVLLSGVAKSLEEKIAATNIAEQVDGVKAVHDNILIQSDASGRDTAPGASVAPVLIL